MLAIVSIFSFNEQIALVLAATITEDDVVDVTATVPGVVVQPPGSGGGGTGTVTAASVTISGYSFPGAKLTLLKDGQIATTLIANNDGTFTIHVNNLNFGNYQFSVYAEDRDGVLSSPYVLNVPVFATKSHPYTGVIVPPTIRTDKATVGPGQSVTVFGYAPANSTVLIEVPNLFNLGSVIADASGFYRFEVRNNLAPGVYQFRTRAQIGATQSMYSRPVDITYYRGQGLPPTPPTQLALCVDYNKDWRINLIDFSILLFWFNKENPPPVVDCNADRRIDIKDFSILMYFWTG